MSQKLHQLPSSQLARVVARVIEVEGPIHREEIARRVAQLFGLRRTGRRINEAVDNALAVVGRTIRVNHEGDFFAPGDQIEVPVRDRTDVEFATLRKPEMIPPAEIRKALVAIVAVHLGVEIDEAVSEASRLLGFKSTKAQLRRVIGHQVQVLIRDQILEERSGKLYVGQEETTKSSV